MKAILGRSLLLLLGVKRIEIMDIILANLKNIPFLPKETIIDLLNEGKHFMRPYFDNAYLELASGTLSYSEC